MHAGESLLAPTVTRRMIESYLARPRVVEGEAQQRLASLTPRELETLALLARGLTNAEIAKALHRPVPTVKAHVSRRFDTLQVTNQVQIAICVHDEGLV